MNKITYYGETVTLPNQLDLVNVRCLYCVENDVMALGLFKDHYNYEYHYKVKENKNDAVKFDSNSEMHVFSSRLSLILYLESERLKAKRYMLYAHASLLNQVLLNKSNWSK